MYMCAKTDRVYVIGIEYCYHASTGKAAYDNYNLVIFPDEESTIAFLNNHKVDEFTSQDRADFTVSILPFGDPDGYYDASPELEAAVDAANSR